MDNIVYGIDFGTTNSSIACVREGRPHVFGCGRNGGKMMRSALFFPNDEDTIFSGDTAVDRYLDYEMDGRLIQSVKTVLPSTTFTSTQIRHTEYEAVDLVAEILSCLKQKADTFTGCNVRRAVLGRPARFSENDSRDALAEKRLREAAYLAGFDDVHLQIEPVAAAFSYERSLSRSERVLVADFGGGTTDFTLMNLAPDRIGKSDRSEDIIDTRGIPVAGDIFDSNIMREKFSEYFGARVRYENWPGKWLPVPANIIADLCHKGRIIRLYHPAVRSQIEEIVGRADDPEPVARLSKLVHENLGFPLFQTVENAKCSLSHTPRTEISFHESGLHLEAALTRGEFDGMIVSEIDAMDHCIDALLSDTGVSTREIDSVFMTGGTSLVPRIREMLAARFGAQKLRRSEETFLSVVTGLALNGDVLSQQ